jgi:hypothetical protein
MAGARTLFFKEKIARRLENRRPLGEAWRKQGVFQGSFGLNKSASLKVNVPDVVEFWLAAADRM